MNFPIKYKFEYIEDLDEFNKPYKDGIIILWEKNGKWELSYTDSEDYQHFIGKGNEYEIESILKIFERDLKIDEILS